VRHLLFADEVAMDCGFAHTCRIGYVPHAGRIDADFGEQGGRRSDNRVPLGPRLFLENLH
jgi:hypothetical protein